MTLPSSGPIDVAAINTEIGLPNTLSSTLSFLNGYLKSPASSPNLGAFFGTAYYQRNVDGNCNNGNCSDSGSGNGNCQACGPYNSHSTPGVCQCWMPYGNANCGAQGGPNGNCATNCNCGNIQCRNCYIAGPSDCGNCQVCTPLDCSNCSVCTPVNCGNCQVCSGINCNNCDSQQYLQPNCNCSGGYNCTTSAVSYNCSSTGGFTINCETSAVSYNCVAGPTSYNCNCACACSKIICTKLHQIGMMPYNIFAADQLYGEWLKKNDRVVYRGYIKWAKIVTSWIDGGGPDFMVWIKDKEKRAEAQKQIATQWAYKIATPWSQHMAYLMGAVKSDNMMGRIIMKIGRPICKIVYFMPKKRIVPDVASTWTMWFFFFFSYYTSLTYTKIFEKLNNIKKLKVFKELKNDNN